MKGKNGFKKFEDLEYEDREQFVRDLIRDSVEPLALKLLSLKFSEFTKKKTTVSRPLFDGKGKQSCQSIVEYEYWVERIGKQVINLEWKMISEKRIYKDVTQFFKYEGNHKFEVDRDGRHLKKVY